MKGKVMKKAVIIVAALVAIVIVLAALSGCAQTEVTVIKPDGTVIKGKATAVLGAEQKGIDLIKEGDDWLFQMEKQESEAEAAVKLIEMGMQIGAAAK